MSLEASPKPKRPSRPPSLGPSMIQTPLQPAEAQTIPSVSTLDAPVYLSVLSETLPDKLVPPARPRSPAPRKPSPFRGDQLTQSEDLNGYKEHWKRHWSTCSGNTADLCHSGTTWAPYEDALPDDTDLTWSPLTQPQDCPTAHNQPPPRPPAPPRPAVPPRPPVVPQRPLMSKCVSDDTTEHLYESVLDVLTDTQLQDERDTSSIPVLPAVPAERSSHSWSEQSSVEGDNGSKELDLLLDWWGSVEEWQQLAMHFQGQETNLLLSAVHRVKMAMRLFELLMFERGRVLLNYIVELHCTADSVDKACKKTRIMGMTGGTTGAVGAVAVIAGLALAPLTFGASVAAVGVGVGIAAAGGVTGASAAITSKVKSSQFRQRVERILKNYKSQTEDIVGSLMFIDAGMEHIRTQCHSNLQHVDSDVVRIVQMAHETESFASIDAIGKCACVLQAFSSGLDSYFTAEDNLRLKKDSESQFAAEVRVMAVRLKEGMDELIRIKNLFRSVLCKNL